MSTSSRKRRRHPMRVADGSGRTRPTVRRDNVDLNQVMTAGELQERARTQSLEFMRDHKSKFPLLDDATSQIEALRMQVEHLSLEKQRRRRAASEELLAPSQVDYKFVQQQQRHAQPWLDRQDLVRASNSSKLVSLGAKSKQLLGKTTALTMQKSGDSSGKTAEFILPQLRGMSSVFRELSALDMSGNRLSKASIVSLAAFLGQRECHVLSLKADNAQISDTCGAMLFEALLHNVSLRTLQLRRNCLKEKALGALSRSLMQNTTLKELSIGGNSVSGRSLRALVPGLTANKGLRNLDMSWNLLGRPDDDRSEFSESPVDIVRALGQALAQNQFLCILDLGNCGISHEHCEALGEGLKRNHTIFGLNFLGNKGLTDAKGFVRTDLAPPDAMQLDAKAVEKGSEADVAGQCWDKAKWSEHVFTFRVGCSCSGPDMGEPVFLHLSVDDWKPDPMRVRRIEPPPTRGGRAAAVQAERVRKTRDCRSSRSSLSDEAADAAAAAADQGSTSGLYEWYLPRMLPPGVVWYFFTQGRRVLCAREQTAAVHPKYGVRRNFVTVERRSGRLHMQDITAVPRSQPWAKMKTRRVNALAAAPPEWDLQRSVFSSRLSMPNSSYFDDEIIPVALETDLEFTKLLSMKILTPEEMDGLKVYLRKVYTPVTILFRWYAATESDDDPFSQSWHEFASFLEAANLLDETVTIEVMHQQFLVTNVDLDPGEESAGNDDDTLARFEFLELMIRLADLKFRQTGRCATILEAMRTLVEDHLEPYRLHNRVEQPDGLRRELLYTRPIGDALAQCRIQLERIFEDHATINDCESGVPKMTLADFLTLCHHGNLLGANFTACDARVVFVNSTIIVANVNTTTAFKEMAFVDFLEAVVRMIHHQVQTHNASQPDRASATVEGVLHNLLSALMEQLYNEGSHGHLVLKRPVKKARKVPLGKHQHAQEPKALGASVMVPLVHGRRPGASAGFSEIMRHLEDFAGIKAHDAKYKQMLGNQGPASPALAKRKPRASHERQPRLSGGSL